MKKILLLFAFLLVIPVIQALQFCVDGVCTTINIGGGCTGTTCNGGCYGSCPSGTFCCPLSGGAAKCTDTSLGYFSSDCQLIGCSGTTYPNYCNNNCYSKCATGNLFSCNSEGPSCGWKCAGVTYNYCDNNAAYVSNGWTTETCSPDGKMVCCQTGYSVGCADGTGSSPYYCCSSGQTCNKGSCAAPACSGTISLSLDKSYYSPGGVITATASGLSACSGRTVKFDLYENNIWVNKPGCTVSGSGCSVSITAPLPEVTYWIQAGVDMNSNGIWDTGEYDHKSFMVSAPSTCTETDSGYDPGTKGTVTVNTPGVAPITDSCQFGSLVEYYCNSQGTKNENVVNCEDFVSGYTCSDGACVAPATTTTAPICTDTDGGNKPETKGTLVHSVYGKLIDYCSNSEGGDSGDTSKYVRELFCGSDGSLETATVLCTNGCSDGACVAPATTTTVVTTTTTTILPSITDGSACTTAGETQCGADGRQYTCQKETTLCKSGADYQTYSSGMAGCVADNSNPYAPGVVQSSAETLYCATGAHLCSPAEYLANNGGTIPPTIQYWLSGTAYTGYVECLPSFPDEYAIFTGGSQCLTAYVTLNRYNSCSAAAPKGYLVAMGCNDKNKAMCCGTPVAGTNLKYKDTGACKITPATTTTVDERVGAGAPCEYALSITPKGDRKISSDYTWAISAADSSSAKCPATIAYSTSYKQTAGCKDLIVPSSFTVSKGGTSSFSIEMGRTSDVCSVSLEIKAPDGTIVDPDYTIASSAANRWTEVVGDASCGPPVTTTILPSGMKIDITYPFAEKKLVPIVTTANGPAPDFTKTMPIGFLVKAKTLSLIPVECNSANCVIEYGIKGVDASLFQACLEEYNPGQCASFDRLTPIGPAWKAERPSKGLGSIDLACDTDYTLVVKTKIIYGSDTGATGTLETPVHINCRPRVTVEPPERAVVLGQNSMDAFTVTVWDPQEIAYTLSMAAKPEHSFLTGADKWVKFKCSSVGCSDLSWSGISTGSATPPQLTVQLTDKASTKAGNFPIEFRATPASGGSVVTSEATIKVFAEGLNEFAAWQLAVMILLSAVIVSRLPKKMR